MFTTNPIKLTTLLTQVEEGQMQLPEFQRSWIWDDHRIRDLIHSVARGFPIGAILRLDSGSSLRFKSRPIEGACFSDPELDHLLLDGQQRMTSLYQALKHKDAVKTRDVRNRRVKRWYYIDMMKAVQEPDNVEIVFSVPESKLETRDFGRTEVTNLTSQRHEFAKHAFPTEMLLEYDDWFDDYCDFWEEDGKEHPKRSARKFFRSFRTEIIDKFRDYDIPVIDLSKTLPREAICLVFEKVNTGGVILGTFELLTASLAGEEFDLRQDWHRRRDALRKFSPVLSQVQSDQFLQAVALLSSHSRREVVINQGLAPGVQPPAIGCRRRDILRLSRLEYETWADRVVNGFKKAASFMHRQCIFRSWDIPYPTQLVPLAVLYALMGHDIETADVQRRLEMWFWSGVFGESYSGSVEGRFARDAQDVPRYLLENSASLQSIDEASFVPDRLLSLRTRRSAAYKGIHAQLLKNGATDWLTNSPISAATFEDENIDIHHVFPRAWCENDQRERKNDLGVKVPSRIYNSVINKSPLSARTNRIIGGRAPSRYIPLLKHENSNVEERIPLHHVDVAALKSDDFAKFFVERGKVLMELIGNAMGKDLPNGEEIFLNALEAESLRVEEDEFIDDEEDGIFLRAAG